MLNRLKLKNLVQTDGNFELIFYREVFSDWAITCMLSTLCSRQECEQRTGSSDLPRIKPSIFRGVLPSLDFLNKNFNCPMEIFNICKGSSDIMQIIILIDPLLGRLGREYREPSPFPFPGPIVAEKNPAQ